MIVFRDISEQKRAEKEREQYFKFFQGASDLMVIADPNGAFLSINPACTEKLGYSEDELVARPFIDFVHPDDRQDTLDEMARQQKIGSSMNFENRYICKDGSYKWLSWRATFVKDEGLTYATARDITDLKQAEQSLRESEERFRSFFELTADMACIAASGYFLQLNEAWEKVLGYSRQELMERPFIDFIHPEDQESTRQVIEEKIAKGETVISFENRYICKDGSIAWLEWTSKPLPELGIEFAIARDITERKRMEHEILAASSYSRNLIETSLDPLVTISTEGKIMDVNKATETVTGISRDTLIGSDFSSYFTDPNKAREGYQQVFEEGSVMDYPLAIRHTSGKITDVLYNAAVYRDESGDIAGIFAAARDITERKNAEEERERLREQLVQAQKMESVGRLAGGIAHDFNNALQTILGNAELALMETSGQNDLRENLEAVKRAGEHSADLTRQLLAFARQQTVDPVIIDLNETVSDILGMLKRLIGENIDVVWESQAEKATIKVDPAQVSQVLANLCVNARDAIDGVGTITIQTRDVRFDEAYVHEHPGFEEGEYILLAVSDDGCGMNEEVREHIFEPFFTTRPIGEGTGLGLATVYGIIRQNDGFVNVYSEPGVGTTFKIYLPLAAGETATKPASMPAMPQGHGETVLLVEDELTIIKVGIKMLESLGYKVIAADNPDRALEIAQTSIEEISLLVTDVVMPGMNGYELATRLQELKPAMRCLFMSGYTSNVITHNGVLDEGLNFMPKPFSIEELADKVRSVLDAE